MKRLKLLAIVTLFFQMEVFGAPSQGALYWEQAVQVASQNNSALQAARASLVAAQNTALADRSGFLPQVSANLGYSYTNTSTVSSGTNVVVGGPNSGGSSASYSASATATQNLFNGLSDLGKYEQGKGQEEVARAALKSVEAQISYNLKTTFGYLVFSKKAVELAMKIVERRATNLRLVELRFKDGQENKGSVLLYEAYLKDAKYAELQARDNVYTGKAQLAQALGLSDFDDLDIQGEVPLHEPDTHRPKLQELVTEAPTYLTAVGQEHVSDAAVVLARSAFLPTLGLTASLGESGASLPSSDRWSIGLGLTIPIFNGGHDYYATQSALQARVAAERTRNDVLYQANYAIANAYTNYVEAVENVKVCQAYLDADNVRVEIARANYRNGLTSFQDWDLVEADLITREKNLLQAEQTRIVTEAAWEQALGRGVF